MITRINAENLAGAKPHDGTQLSTQLWEETFLRPNDKSCKFCKAKATCPALRADATQTFRGTTLATPDEFSEVEVIPVVAESDEKWLGAVLAKADLIEDWLKAVRAEVERRLLAGLPVPGYKVVQGKRGNRAWGDSEAAEAQLKAMRLKVEEMYDLKLISPASAEKLTKGDAPVIGPRQWTKVKALITQSEGRPSVAPQSDPRPALVIKPLADEFDAAPQPETEIDFA